MCTCVWLVPLQLRTCGMSALLRRFTVCSSLLWYLVHIAYLLCVEVFRLFSMEDGDTWASRKAAQELQIARLSLAQEGFDALVGGSNIMAPLQHSGAPSPREDRKETIMSTSCELPELPVKRGRQAMSSVTTPSLDTLNQGLDDLSRQIEGMQQRLSSAPNLRKLSRSENALGSVPLPVDGRCTSEEALLHVAALARLRQPCEDPMYRQFVSTAGEKPTPRDADVETASKRSCTPSAEVLRQLHLRGRLEPAEDTSDESSAPPRAVRGSRSPQKCRSPARRSAHSSPAKPRQSPKKQSEQGSELGSPATAAAAAAVVSKPAQQLLPPPPPSRDGRIKVVVRKRPFNSHEEGTDCVSVESPALTLHVVKRRIDLTEYTETLEFAFDAVYNVDCRNADVYAGSTKSLLGVALAGGSASCFAYGQTGSGKTYTVMGAQDEKGLVFLGAVDLFQMASPDTFFDVSFYEIYCNSLFDLLNARSPVTLREDANKKVNLCGLSWQPIHSADQLWAVVEEGMEQRSVGSTSANERSSRSHAILSIRVRKHTDSTFEGVMNFVDLAGSERAADTANNDKQTRLEGAEINKSLLALKECIRSLDEKKKHVPFRGCRLTEVLRDSFTGNSQTVMIANISPSSINYDHTANTLRYAFRVKGLSVPVIAPNKARNAPRPRVRSTAPSSSAARDTSPSKLKNILNGTPGISAAAAAAAAQSDDGGILPPVRTGSRSFATEEKENNDVSHRIAELRTNSSSPAARNHKCICQDPEYLAKLKAEMKTELIKQLEVDLGKEIMKTLDERDAVITMLMQENENLKKRLHSLGGGTAEEDYSEF